MAFKTISKKKLYSSTKCVIPITEVSFDRNGNQCSSVTDVDVLSSEFCLRTDKSQFSLEAQLASNQPLKRVDTRILLDNVMPTDDMLIERVPDVDQYDED